MSDYTELNQLFDEYPDIYKALLFNFRFLIEKLLNTMTVYCDKSDVIIH